MYYEFVWTLFLRSMTSRKRLQSTYKTYKLNAICPYKKSTLHISFALSCLLQL